MSAKRVRKGEAVVGIETYSYINKNGGTGLTYTLVKLRSRSGRLRTFTLDGEWTIAEIGGELARFWAEAAAAVVAYDAEADQ